MERLYGWPRSPGVRLVYIAKAVYDGMKKGRISSPNHAYALLTARISNRSSGVRVSVAVALRVIFRAVCSVFPVLCDLCCESGYACLWAEEREYPPHGRYSLPVCSGCVGYSVLWSMLALTSLVSSSSAGMMSLSRLLMIPPCSRSRKASRSAVESAWDVWDWHIIFRTASIHSSMRRDFSTRWASSR